MKPRLLSILLATYVVLLVYASLMPFDFSAGAEDVREHLDRAWGVWPFGNEVRTSRGDVVSNLAVYVPLGWLAATWWTTRRRWPAASAVIAAVLTAMTISVAVEAGQLLGLSRSASAQDVLMNTIGGSVGAIAGGLFGRAAWLGLVRGVRRRLRRRPVALAAGLMVLMLAVDGLFPLIPTIDVSQVKDGLKRSQVSLRSGLAEHPYHHWLVAKLAVATVLTWLLAASSRRRAAPQEGTIAPAGRRGLGGDEVSDSDAPASLPAWVRSAALATGLAVALEMCKPFIIGRHANMANVVVAAGGALIGLVTGLLARGWSATGRQKLLIAAVLLAGYLVYLELEPFDFAWDAALAERKFPHGIQWLPLYHYAMGSRLEHARLFLRTLLLVGSVSGAIYLAGAETGLARFPRCLRKTCLSPFGGTEGKGDRRKRGHSTFQSGRAEQAPFAQFHRPLQKSGTSQTALVPPYGLPWVAMLTAGVLAGAFGAALESGQFFLASRNPSTTDVFMFAAGGVLGVRAGYEYLRRRRPTKEANSNDE